LKTFFIPLRFCSRLLPVLATIAFLLGLGLGLAPAKAIETAAKEAFLVDFETGAVLFEKNADTPMPPSSMSKLMTIFMVFEHLRDGSLSLDDQLPVSVKAWRKGGSKMFVREGDNVTVEDLIHGVIVHSGNDACIVLAEGLAGSEDAFAEAMTLRAHELGLENSFFKNSTGWPDPEHMMTARDLALLAELTIREFPQYYHFYAEKSFQYGKGMKAQPNRNPLLYKPRLKADGLKTGHTEAGGFGITASAEKDGRRLIMVLNGMSSIKERAKESERILEWGFREFNNYNLFTAGETVTQADVWLGAAPTVPLVINQNLIITLPRKARRGMVAKVIYNEPIPAPVTQGDKLARLIITAPDSDPIEIPLYAGAGVARLGSLGRIQAALGYLLWGSLVISEPQGSN
jgi:serine-type D-Ala-D-Ala carboxypeptidase (penicillin-binding protein 5/6)